MNPQKYESTAAPGVPPGTDELSPVEREPLGGTGALVDALLRQPRRLLFNLQAAGSESIVVRLACVTLVCAIAYGFIAGTFSGGAQLWAAPLKIAGGLVFAALLCLPSLYVFACLSGARVGLGEVTGLMAGLVSLSAIVLFTFAPVAWVFSQSTESVAAMGGLHLAFALIAFLFGLRFLWQGFRQWGARAFGGAVAWTILFALVTLQLTTALRPIIGRSTTVLPAEKKFFLAHWGDCLDGRFDGGRPEAPPEARR